MCFLQKKQNLEVAYKKQPNPQALQQAGLVKQKKT